MNASVQTHALSPHPSSPPVPVSGLSVTATRNANSLLLRYQLAGDLDSLELPRPGPKIRADELWRHTCFEVFVGGGASTEYCEYNFSPSGAWAAYRFSDYRAGMRVHTDAAPDFQFQARNGTLELSATVDLRWLKLSRDGVARLGVTAVIEARSGGLSYWALRHCEEKPDFHHAGSFVLNLR